MTELSGSERLRSGTEGNHLLGGNMADIACGFCGQKKGGVVGWVL
jgi:hypothetical protein